MNNTHLFKDWEDDGDIYICRLTRTTVMVVNSQPQLVSINGIHVPYSDEIIEQINAMVKP